MAMMHLSSPMYLIPLHDEELLVVGRITVMWARLDWQVNEVISSLFPPQSEEVAKLEQWTMGPKISALRRWIRENPGAAHAAALRTVCDGLDTAITGRNEMAHGSWGFEFRPGENLYHRCARLKAGRVLYVSRIAELHEQVCAAAVSADAAWSSIALGQEPFPTRNRRFIFTPGIPPDQMPGPPATEEFVR